MNRLRSRSIAATLLAAGLLLSACGQSDASGRIRNSAPAGECYATQEEKDGEVAFYQRQADEARRLGELRDELKKKQDDLGAAYKSMLPKDGETWSSLYAKIDNTSQAALDEWDQMMEAVYQANLAAAAAAGEYAAANNEYRALPQYNHYLAQVSEKPVCVTTIPAAPLPDNSETEAATPDVVPEIKPEGTPEPEVPSTDNSVSQSAAPETETTTPIAPVDDECLAPPVLSTGSDYTVRVGEELVLEIPLCPKWGEKAGITIGADGSVSSRVETSVKASNGTSTAFIRITSTRTTTTSFWIYQSKRSWPYANSDKTHFSVTVVPVETVDPCANKTPNVAMNNEGLLTAEFDCEAATHIEMIFTDVETNEIKAQHLIPIQDGKVVAKNYRKFFGTRKYVIESAHLLQTSDTSSRRRVGDTNWYEFQLEEELTNQINQPFDPLGIIDLPPVLFVEPVPESDSDSQSSDGGEPIVSPAIAVVEPRTTSIKCDEACTDNVVKQSGIEPAKVQVVEASVNGSAWETVTPELLLPLAIDTTTIQLRVTPKDDARPVVLSTTVYKDAAAVYASTESQTLIVSGSGTQSVEVVADDDGSGSMTLIVVIIALLAGLLIVAMTVLSKIRRKSELS